MHFDNAACATISRNSQQNSSAERCVEGSPHQQWYCAPCIPEASSHVTKAICGVSAWHQWMCQD